MKKKDLKKLKELIIKYDPDSLFYSNSKGKYCATSEFLVGSFGGRSFEDEIEENALNKLWKYLSLHIGDDSLVGSIVTRCGWPDLDKVEEFLKCLEEN